MSGKSEPTLPVFWPCSMAVHKQIILNVVLSLDPDILIEIRKRKSNEARKMEAGHEVGEERKLIAYGTGMRFNRVEEKWVVASLSRFGRAKLSGGQCFSVLISHMRADAIHTQA